MFCEMLDQDVPTPESATDIELDDHLFRQRFCSKQTVPELVAFFAKEMKRFGWAMPCGKQFGDRQAGMFLTRSTGDPIYLEILRLPDGTTSVYMAGPTRQVSRAVKSEFENEYERSLPLGQTRMHELDYQAIPFCKPLDEGAGRSIAEAVFFNTNSSYDEVFLFYRDYFSELGWQPSPREDQFIGDQLHRSSVMFQNADAEIMVSARPWGESIRVTIDGNGIRFPGAVFCHMMARGDEARDIDW